MTPRASEDDTMALLKPLSSQPIALASDGGTPLAAAMSPTCEALTRWSVGTGGPLELRRALAPTGWPAPGSEEEEEEEEEPPDSVNRVPERSSPLGSRPLSEASCERLPPACSAIPDRVSPGW